GKCLTRDPRQRLRDISGVRLLLEEGDPPAPVIQAASTHWPLIAMAAVATIAALVATFAWYRSSRSVEHPLARLSIDLGPEAFADSRTLFILSPDNKRIVYTARSPEGSVMLAARELDQTKSNLLRGTEGASDPFFSPDGEWVGFFAEGKMKKI